MEGVEVGSPSLPTGGSFKHQGGGEQPAMEGSPLLQQQAPLADTGDGSPTGGGCVEGEGKEKKEEEIGPTLYITIGVQCAGKTTVLRSMQCTDIALDDHDGIYKPVPWTSLSPSTQGRIVWEALTCPAEDPSNVKENWIAKFQNSIPIKGYHPAKRAELATQLWDAVARLRKEGLPEASPTFDQMNFNMLQPAISGSLKRLEAAMAAGQPKVAWGNTNRFLADMYAAVLLAEKYNYKVDFIMLNDTPFTELLYRNVKRGFTTGKYIPAETMWRAKQDVYRLLKDGVSVEKIKATKGDRSTNNRRPSPRQQQQPSPYHHYPHAHTHHNNPAEGNDQGEKEEAARGRGGKQKRVKERQGRSPTSPSSSPTSGGNIFDLLMGAEGGLGDEDEAGKN